MELENVPASGAEIDSVTILDGCITSWTMMGTERGEGLGPAVVPFWMSRMTPNAVTTIVATYFMVGSSN